MRPAETRVAANGRAYTIQEFLEYYGPAGWKYWNDAAGASSTQYASSEQSNLQRVAPQIVCGDNDVLLTRVALDGRAYTIQEFWEYYGPAGWKCWKKAAGASSIQYASSEHSNLQRVASQIGCGDIFSWCHDKRQGGGFGCTMLHSHPHRSSFFNCVPFL